MGGEDIVSVPGPDPGVHSTYVSEHFFVSYAKDISHCPYVVVAMCM